MREVSIQNSKKFILVDDEDFEKVNKVLWYLNKNGKLGGFLGVNKFESILNIIVPNKVGMYDHKDRNCLNNQKANLRPTTYQLNMANTNKFKNVSSKYKGVSWCKRDQVWRAYIKLNGKSRALGTFDDEWKAAAAYNREARIEFGEFAVFNSKPESVAVLK